MAGRPRKRFGQHFLHDARLIARIVDVACADAPRAVVEIGPGRGALTAPLAERVPELHVVEIDRELAAELRKRFATHRNVAVHCTDALHFDPGSVASPPLRVVGNLPYNISTPLVFHLLRHAALIDRMIVMLQLEVARRLAASAGSEDYGRLGVMVQSRCRVEKLFDVAPGAFRPPPRVESAVVQLTPVADPHGRIDDPALFARIVQAAFSGRRKMLRNALQGVVAECGATLEALDIDGRLRPEVLPVGDYVRLANRLANRCHPSAADRRD
jgi:16S rRNA (adenine1518-N6/adenine1519-N6)-dimethyltransferase